MSVASDLHKIAKFHADHPDLPAPSVSYYADSTWESNAGPKQVAAFLDGLDDIDVRDVGSTYVRVDRKFGAVGVSLSAPRSLVVLIEAETTEAVYATPEQIRQRACAACESVPFAEEINEARGER